MNVKINSLNHEGKGITKIDNKVTFVENALPEELVNIEITKHNKNYDEAKVKKYLKKSTNRRKPLCPYYMECGGCDIMHATYEYQLKFKKEKVINILKKYSNLDIDPQIIASNKETNYRNKITLHYKNNCLGYMKKKTNEVLKINNCPLAMENINNYIKEIQNEKNDIILITNGKEVITSKENKHFIKEINNLKFQVDVKSFFQVNDYICGKLFQIVDFYMEENAKCLDLYSGVGTLSIVASRKARVVYSIEINESSHKNALTNLQLNKINNIKSILGKVEEEIKKIHDKIDVIITDPPRKGMDKVTIDIINKLSPKKIIYISCNPITLARDINLLKSYKLDEIILMDMFPNTYHVECVCLLKRK